MKKSGIYSICLLLILLFPMVQREVHTFHHKNDISCSAEDTKHLHEQHHYCKYCDFSVPAHVVSWYSFDLNSVDFVVFLPGLTASLVFDIEKGSSGPPRAPPSGVFKYFA